MPEREPGADGPDAAEGPALDAPEPEDAGEAGTGPTGSTRGPGGPGAPAPEDPTPTAAPPVSAPPAPGPASAAGPGPSPTSPRLPPSAPVGADGTVADDPLPDPDAPRLPTLEEAATYRPAQDLFIAFLDIVSEATLGTPLRPRLKVSPGGLLRGEIDLLKIELPAYAVAGLVVDRFVVRAERVRIQPGIPPLLVAEPVGLRVVVSQENVDRWTRDLRLPFRLRLTEDGVVTTTGFGGIRFTEILTVPTVTGGFLRLQPRRASLLGVPTPLVRFLRGYLPLPPLPRAARLEQVDPTEGELTLTFRIDRFEQPLTPDVTRRIGQVLRLPLPGLR